MAESAAQQFALFCEENGWEVERKIINEGETKIVIATGPEGETVSAEWFQGAALGPIGAYTAPGGAWSQTLRNRAEAKRAIDGSKVPQPPTPKPVRDPSAPPKRKKKPAEGEQASKEIENNIPFDLYEVTDDELIASLAGHSITWQTQYGYETAKVPPLVTTKTIHDKKNNTQRQVQVTNPSIKVTLSKSAETEGERIFNFCSMDTGYRATFVGALVRIG